jgi:transcription termination factor NusB
MSFFQELIRTIAPVIINEAIQLTKKNINTTSNKIDFVEKVIQDIPTINQFFVNKK